MVNQPVKGLVFNTKGAKHFHTIVVNKVSSMESLKIDLGVDNRSLRLEPDNREHQAGNKFRIYVLESDDSWKESGELDIERVPVDNLLGTITVRNAKDFTFDGKGDISGEDLLFIANYICKHPSFSKPDSGENK